MQKSNVADNQQATATEIEKAWLAGLIDGEGSIRIDYPNGTRNSPSARLVITNTDYEIIEKAVSVLRKLDCNPHVQIRKRTGRYKDVKDVLVLGHPKLFRILPTILPYLTGRKEQAALLMYRFCESRLAKGNINKLGNRDRLYSKDEIDLVYQIKQVVFQGRSPQRPYAEPEREDMV